MQTEVERNWQKPKRKQIYYDAGIVGDNFFPTRIFNVLSIFLLLKILAEIICSLFIWTNYIFTPSKLQIYIRNNILISPMLYDIIIFHINTVS